MSSTCNYFLSSESPQSQADNRFGGLLSLRVLGIIPCKISADTGLKFCTFFIRPDMYYIKENFKLSNQWSLTSVSVHQNVFWPRCLSHIYPSIQKMDGTSEKRYIISAASSGSTEWSPPNLIGPEKPTMGSASEASKSEVKTSLPGSWQFFHCLYPQSPSFSHYSKLIATGKIWKIDWLARLPVHHSIPVKRHLVSHHW